MTHNGWCAIKINQTKQNKTKQNKTSFTLLEKFTLCHTLHVAVGLNKYMYFYQQDQII